MQIYFWNHTATESQSLAISKHLAELERMFGGIIAGQVVVEGVTKHHHTGVSMASAEAGKRERGRCFPGHLMPTSGIHIFISPLTTPFRRTQRQLRDQVDRMQGEVETGIQQPIGTIAMLFEGRAFLKTTEGLEVYFHKKGVLDAGFSVLKSGARVTYFEVPGPGVDLEALFGEVK